MAEELNIGRKVQEFRKNSGMSLRELAAQADVSASMLSQIENDTAAPSINTLRNIAEALNVPLFQFFVDDTRSDQLIVRRGENRIIGHMEEEVLYKLLTPDTNGSIEFCLMEIPAGTASSDILREHAGEEVTYIIKGEATLHMNGMVHRLYEGDSVRIPALTRHRWINNGTCELQAVFAITPPTF